MPATLRCFVAMAFGREDSDAIYTVIRQTLKPLGITTRRVDRIEHNENIDRKISTARDHFEELGYAVTDLRQVQGDKPQIEHELRSGLAAIKQRGQKFRFVFFHVVPSVTARVLGAYRFSLMLRPFYDLRLLEPPRVVPTDIYEDIIVCSMQTRSLHRLRSNLPMLRVGEAEGTLREDVEHRFRRGEQDVITTRHMTFHVLETSARLAMLPEFLKERFSRVAHLPTQSSYIHKQREPIVIRPMRIVVRARPS